MDEQKAEMIRKSKCGVLHTSRSSLGDAVATLIYFVDELEGMSKPIGEELREPEPIPSLPTALSETPGKLDGLRDEILKQVERLRIALVSEKLGP